MTKYQVIVPVAAVHGVPDANALRGKFETQLVQGEMFLVAEEKDGWCRGVCAHDDYPGYVERKYLARAGAAATHVVTAARSHAYREATIKSPMINTFSFGSLIVVTALDEKFAQLDNGAWIFKKHIALADQVDGDYVATAKKILETPYYWGGRSGFGIDCSGLVQVSLARAGIAAPRDTEMQVNAIGKAAEIPQAGDLVFFADPHVGIMADDCNLIHANAFYMKTVIEPLENVVDRNNKIIAIRRL